MYKRKNDVKQTKSKNKIENKTIIQYCCKN